MATTVLRFTPAMDIALFKEVIANNPFESEQRISSGHKQLAIIEILEKKQQAEERFKEKQLELEERRLVLEERKLALEEQRMQLMRQGRAGNPEYDLY